MTASRKLMLFCILLITEAQAFNQETGRPFIRNYPPLEYRASQQNWAVAQDRRGIMFFGNNDGLLEFDGTSWQLIKLSIVRAIAIDSLGRIYVGLENDMGYLEPDSSGNYHYYSLKAKIPEIHRDITTVVNVYSFGRKVIYLVDDKIFIYENNRIKVLVSEQGFHSIFSVHNQLYTRERGKGLFYLDNDSLRFIKGSERFASERIYSMLPYRQNEIIIATRTQGTLVYAPDKPDKFYKPEGFSEVDNFLLKNPVYCGTKLADGDFAVGALTGGIIVFSTEGKIKYQFNKDIGLLDNTIYWLYSDRNNQLWAALDNGISMIPVNLPFRYYTEANGLNGSPMCLKFFDNRFYVGTSQHLHIQNKQGNFEQIAGTEGQNFHLFNANGTLLLACYQGIFDIRDKQAFQLSKNIIGLSFCSLKNNSGYLLAGTADEGLYLMEKKDSSWTIKNPIRGFRKSVYHAVEDINGDIWISTAVDLYKLRINNTYDSVIFSRQYTFEDGLPSNYASPYIINTGEVIFGSEKGVYRYRTDYDRFEPHPDFQILTGKVLPFVQLSNGDIWFEELTGNGNYEKGVLKYTQGKYIQYRTPFYKFTDIRCYESAFIFCPAPDSTIFIGTSSGLIQFNPSIKLHTDQPFTTLIRKVYSRDKLLFGGASSNKDNINEAEEKLIPFLQNDLIFHFSATFYEDPEKTLYSYRLVGSDTAWSAWVTDQKKEYTNLIEGKYTFEVKSKNQYRTIGSTASFSFSVRPPWFRTWWAYGLYAISTMLLIWSIVMINIKRLVAQKKHLEEIVANRTATVVQQKEEIEMKNMKLNNTLELVSSQKKVIETAHKEITASITYAKKIQSAVLPKVEQIEALLGEHFILFKPAEIVSGDFYWVSERNDKTIIVVADCTGHGVPGAFMSMLGITFLDEIVNKELVTNPDEILNKLRKEVISSLKQKGELKDQKDGMDIGLCTIDKKKMKLNFAGAINPLYLIRKSSVENDKLMYNDSSVENILFELKGDPMPVGISDSKENFTHHEIDIQKGDIFYMFTDGFPDQFGGVNHKKFSYKQFKEQLIKTNSKTLKDQKLLLEKVLSEWMGNNSQTDDILVIGFRIN